MSDTVIYIHYDESGKGIFSYQILAGIGIEIQKWFDTSGDIVIPDRIGNNRPVSSIGHNAFALTDQTTSIRILPKECQIQPDSFIYTGDAYYSPTVMISQCFEYQHPLHRQLSAAGWFMVYQSWGERKYIRSQVLHKFTDSSAGVELVYRKINPFEIEIVRWISPLDHIHIPQEIGSMSVCALGEQSFARNPKAREIYVPDSVKLIKAEAFYYEDDSAYIFGDLYDPGWSTIHDPQDTCRLRLPGSVSISNLNALYRRTWWRNRRRGDSYENHLIISTSENAEVLVFLTEHNWRIDRTADGVAYLSYKDSRTYTLANA